jgi:DNA-binding GntR family transcriptional regulator
MAMKFSELMDADQRLVILRMLAEDGDYSHNEFVLQDALALMGHHISRDKLRTHLAWLEEQGLVRIEDVSGVKVAKLTARGADTAAGRAVVPGVKRPGPED